MPIDDDILQKQGRTTNPLSGAYSTTTVAVVGFPEEHKDEKWGMTVDVSCDKREEWEERDNKEILVYDFIDTSPARSEGKSCHGNEPRRHFGGAH